MPASAELHALDDAAIIERLTQVRGIGRWTVEMLLMFQLGRPDVLPVDDFGVRNGFRLAYGLQGMPRAARAGASSARAGRRTARSPPGTCGARWICRASKKLPARRAAPRVARANSARRPEAADRPRKQSPPGAPAQSRRRARA